MGRRVTLWVRLCNCGAPRCACPGSRAPRAGHDRRPAPARAAKIIVRLDAVCGPCEGQPDGTPRPREAHMRRTGRALALTAALAALATGCLGSSNDNGGDTNRNAQATNVTLSIAANAVPGGKNAQEADWINNWVIPRFVEAEKAKGVTAKMTFQPSGVADEDFKSKIALDLRSKSGADVLGLDGIWVGEFAEAGYIKPLDDLLGSKAGDWDGWGQIPDSVQQLMMYNGKRFGIPAGTDGRVLFFNKKLFRLAGLPADWQPRSWADILAAGQKLRALAGVT